MGIFEEARGFIKDKRYKKISDTMIDIGHNNVSLVTKKGRNLLICSCHNDTKFCNESPICSHKICWIILKFNNSLYEEIDNALDEIKRCKELNMPISNYFCKDILEKIRRAE
jgi:hypothetical protein